MKKWVSMVFGLVFLASACASNDDDNPGSDDGPRGDASPFADARPSADARPFVDAGPIPDGGFMLGDGGFDFGDGGFGGDCATDEDCEVGECCAELIPGVIKVCIDKAEDAGPGECTFTFPGP